MAEGADGHASRVVLLGPPGAGKGTQAQVLGRCLGVPAISTGDLLREAVAAESELGQRVRESMGGGKLVADDVMAEVVRERLEQPDARGGYLLDGYPRTLPQAETLEGMLRDAGERLDAVLLFDVPEEIVVRRALLPRTTMDLWLLTPNTHPLSLAAQKLVECIRSVVAPFDRR